MTFAENSPDRAFGPYGIAAAIALVGILGLLTFLGSVRFQNSETLWRHTIRLNPRSWMAHGNLARLLASKGLHAEAESHYRAVTLIRPDLADGYFNLGVELFSTGRT